jgi:ArsR family transcriptional regulator
MDKAGQVKRIHSDFEDVRGLLSVIGDETRQLILLVLMECDDCAVGIRVGDITAKTHLSRPAVSHQLKVLKDLGIVGVRHEGTMNFYHIDVRNNRAMFERMRKLVDDVDGLLGLLGQAG